jgi:hypothetical protein
MQDSSRSSASINGGPVFRLHDFLAAPFCHGPRHHQGRLVLLSFPFPSSSCRLCLLLVISCCYQSVLSPVGQNNLLESYIASIFMLDSLFSAV